MQTNAPAGGEWVDQFNRAIAFGQINISPFGIGAAPYASAGARILACWSNVELIGVSVYSVLGSPKDVYGNAFITPPNSRSVIDGYAAVVRSFSGTAATNPIVRAYVGGTTITSGNQGDTTLQLSGTLQLGGSTPVGGIFTNSNVLPSPGKTFLAASSSPQLILTTVGTGFTTYKADIFASIIVLPAAV